MAEYKQVTRSEFLFQNDKVETSKLRLYLETYGRSLERSVQSKTCPKTLFSYLLCMATERLVRGRT